MQALSNRYLDSTLETRGVDRPTLRALAAIVDAKDGTVVVAGFTDYAKHLVNMFPDKITAIWDEDTDLKGVRFREVPVVTSLPPVVDHVVATRFDDLYRVQSQVLRERQGAVTFSHPPTLDGELTRDLQTHRQTPFYQQLLADRGAAEAVESSMMGFDKIVFLVELLRSTANVEGNVAEIGVWQGGSAYYLALALRQMESTKSLFLLDFFEELDRNQPKGIMCEDQLHRQFEFYPHTKFVVGDIRRTVADLDGQPLSFVHYDMGYQPTIVDVVVDNLSPGGMVLLDNYGHLAGRPGMFDEHFSRAGLHVTRVPYTEQALVFNSVRPG